MGAYPKYQKRSEIGGYALQDTAVGVGHCWGTHIQATSLATKAQEEESWQTDYYLHRLIKAKCKTGNTRNENSDAGQECVEGPSHFARKSRLKQANIFFYNFHLS